MPFNGTPSLRQRIGRLDITEIPLLLPFKMKVDNVKLKQKRKGKIKSNIAIV